MSRIRTFVAVDLDDAPRAALDEALRDLRARARRAGWSVSWVEAGRLHVTLKFLGPLDSDRFAAAVAALSSPPPARHQAFDLEVEGAGAFPSPARPRVLWVGLRDVERRLAALAAEVDERLCAAGFAREPRAFHPHATLGRVKRAGPRPEELLAPLVAARFGATRVREWVVYQSLLGGSGSQYIARARIPIGAASPSDVATPSPDRTLP